MGCIQSASAKANAQQTNGSPPLVHTAPASATSTPVVLPDFEDTPLNDLTLGCLLTLHLDWEWLEGTTPTDLDLAALLFGPDGKYKDIAYFNKREAANGAIKLGEDDRSGQGGEELLLDTTPLSDFATYVVLVVTSHTGSTFTNVETGRVTLKDEHGKELHRMELGSMGKATGLVMCCLYIDKTNFVWHLAKTGVTTTKAKNVDQLFPLCRQVLVKLNPSLKDAMARADSKYPKLNFFKAVTSVVQIPRDYIIVVDKSGSMSGSNWSQAREAVTFLAPHIVAADPDGCTVYFFSDSFVKQDNVTSAEDVKSAFNGVSPDGSTNLAAVLRDIFDSFFAQPSSASAPRRPASILIITDGEPDSRPAVEEVIINATTKMNRDEELSVSFIQVGNDSTAATWLTALDDDLSDKGAKWDIVDKLTATSMQEVGFNKMIEASIND